MLAKVHLKTACGCTKVFFDTMPTVYPGYRVPISATRTNLNEPGLTPTESWGVRGFILSNWHWISSRRIELWYEKRFTVADLILGALLVFYAELAKWNGHTWASLVVAACAVVVLGNKLLKELRK